MTQFVSVEFLVVVLFIIDLFFALLLFLFVKRVKQIRLDPGQVQESTRKDFPGEAAARESAREIMDMLEPLVRESRKAALSFDDQIREKRKLSKDLNEALDSRIININLLLSRAEALQGKLETQHNLRQQAASVPREPFGKAGSVMDQQHQILSLYSQGENADTIAEKLSIPKGEVQLVIHLKEKFIAMEQGQ